MCTLRRGIALTAAALLLLSPVAFCARKSVLIKGRVAREFRGLSIRVELFYDEGERGSATQIELASTTFRVRMEYSEYENCDGAIIAPFRDPCKLKLKQVIVRLIDGDREVDHATLRVPKDFRWADKSELVVRSDVILGSGL